MPCEDVDVGDDFGGTGGGDGDGSGGNGNGNDSGSSSPFSASGIGSSSTTPLSSSSICSTKTGISCTAEAVCQGTPQHITAETEDDAEDRLAVLVVPIGRRGAEG